jgi:SAM-dependent methyltransferase
VAEDTRWADAERAYHNEHADRYVEELERGHIFHLADAQLLYRHLLPTSPHAAVILDAGCGPAISVRKFLLERLRPADRYIGVDIAEQLLAVASATIPTGRFVHLDLQRLRLRPASVDAVLCLGALHHLPQPFAVLATLLGAVSPGGLLLLREPTDRAFRRGEGESPAEEGLNVDALKGAIAQQGGRIEEEVYLTSWAFIHLRRYLQRFHLNGWERWTFPWKVKLWAELLLDRVTGGHLPRHLKGLDVYLVIRKEGAPPAAPARDHDRDFHTVFACPDCGRTLSWTDAHVLTCPCGTRLRSQDGVWTFHRAADRR